jgi:hypothetical protein
LLKNKNFKFKKKKKKIARAMATFSSIPVSDGSIGGPGMALATPQVLQKKKNLGVKKKKLQAIGPAPKKFISRPLPIKLSRSVLGTPCY